MDTKNTTAPAKAFSFDASISVGNNGPEAKTAPVRLLARTGKPIEHWYWGRVVHDLEGMKLSKPRLPIDWVHTDELIGTLTKFDISSGDLVASGFLKTNPARSPDHAAIIMHDMQGEDSIPYEASINFAGDGIVIEDIPAGQRTQVNGYTFDGPGCVIREWPLRGVAICPYGADGSTQTTAFNEADTISFKFKEIAKMSDSNPVVEAEPKAVEATVTTTQTDAVKPEETQVATPVAVEPTQLSAQPQGVEADGKRYIEAFGDRGARMFVEGVPFELAASKFVAELRDSHRAELVAKDDRIAELSSQLEAAKVLGGDPIPARVEKTDSLTKEPEKARLSEKRKAQLGENTAKIAAGITLPGKTA